MKSPTFQLKTIAPVAVALSLTLAMAANAQTTSIPESSPFKVTVPVSAASAPNTIALLQSQEPVIDPAEFTSEIKPTVIATTNAVAHASVFATEKTNVVGEKAAVSAVENKVATSTFEDKTATSTAEDKNVAPSVTEATDLTPGVLTEPGVSTEPLESKPTRSIASSTDAGDASVQLRGEAAAPNAPSDATDTAGDTAQLRPIDIAQSSPNDATTSPDNRDFDLTPVNLPRRAPAFNRFEGMQSSLLYALPSRMFFSATVDNSLRAETNVFQTRSRNRTDMVYRILPNTVLGYALTRSTRISANYFFLRDQYTKYQLLDRNFHSVGFQIDQDLYNKNGTTVTAGFLGRALFANPDQFSDQFFNDLLPSIYASKQIGGHAVVYGSIIGQIRFREVLSQFQEGDQFYSVGSIYRKGPWQLLGDFTLNNNFGNSNLRQGENNQVIILTEEIARRIPFLRRLPVDAYVRAQQIFNMGAQNSPGYAGVNTRIFGGIRAYIAKPPVYPVKLAGK
ncbi:MAG: hypothetical protein SGJ27_13745 [Candidatus Melainabacteria bacterium]|nr:hypothetical protein [Candidatus Melainabacteria bacterium]